MCDNMIKYASTDISPGDSNNPRSPHVTQTLRFTLPPPSLHQHTRVPTSSSIRVKVPELTRCPPEPTALTSTPPQHFFVLPVQRVERISVHDPQAQFKLFRMCVCGPNDPENTWELHLLDEPRPNVKTPQQFIRLFAPALLANTWAFLKSSWMSQGHAESYFMSSSSASIVEGYYQHVDILCSELGLHSVGDVQRLLFEMVEQLKSLLLPHKQFAHFRQPFAFEHPSLERCRLSLDEMALLPMYVDLSRLDAPSTFLTFNENGNDLWICHYHNRRSDPKRRQHHVKHTIKKFGKHNYSVRTIKVNLLSPRYIAAVCRIDRVKAGLAVELTVTLP
ncbi:MAG: hypothetical protein J3R72DRAFT_169834 [Linnemannia gamsii]|nr:MAG: hypothetical protein J3R72DRAFT_169834 [Linnemannia gamsii]